MAVAFRPIWQASFPPFWAVPKQYLHFSLLDIEVSESAGMAAREVKQFRQDRQRTRMASISLIACGMVSGYSPPCSMVSKRSPVPSICGSCGGLSGV
jgi:hypothetical protein